jgi:hypothetical protein
MVGRVLRSLAVVALAALPAAAFVPPQDEKNRTLEFSRPELQYPQLHVVGSAVASQVGADKFSSLGVSPESSYLDQRTGRFSGIQPVTPLLPGTGVGNQLTWTGLGKQKPSGDIELGQAAWDAYRGYLEQNAQILGLDLSQVVSPGRVSIIDPNYIVIYTPRVVAGLPVLGSGIVATIRYGNLVLWGTMNWGDVDASLTARIDETQAVAAVQRHLGAVAFGSSWKGSELAWQPVSADESLPANSIGGGLEYRLVWIVRPDLGERGARWQGLVDATNGDLLSFRDLRDYAVSTREVKGGVFPIGNDGKSSGGAPDGVEQAGWPMPFSDVTNGATTYTTDAGGNLPFCLDGSISSSLSGTFLHMTDTCGSALTSSSGDLDFGTSTGTNCTVPPGTGAGNTHASRSGYFELNQQKALARSHLPNNTWLQDQLTANMNINQTCNANWNGVDVNFYRSGGGCRNTGELAGVFDHEWGHGMDNNDAIPATLSTGAEAIADTYAALRLFDSCMGRGFRSNDSGCTGYGNPCVDPDGAGPEPICSGVRDIDWDRRSNHSPTTLTTIATCGGEVHCVSYVASESVWDVWNRELRGAPFNLPRDVTREIAVQMVYRGSGGINNFWSGAFPNAGCPADTGYKNYLAADDDNGNINDGTPHMQAIFDSFNRHKIACNTPTVTTSGCAGSPTAAPVVTATVRDRIVDLSWTSVAGASTYRVLRTDGLHGCDMGKVQLADTPGNSYTDVGLQDGRTYYYVVLPVGANDECFGSQASACTPATPSAATATLAALPELAQFSGVDGDGDAFADNCEAFRVEVPLSNTSSVTLTNVRILSASSPSHPSSTIVTALPKDVTPSFATCGSAVAILDVIPQGLNANDVFTVNLQVTADQLASPLDVAVSYIYTEQDFQNVGSQSFTFEGGTEGWQTTRGIFVRTNAAPGGVGGAGTFYYQSSANADNQCDVVQSPLFALHPDSTLTLSTRFRTEVFSSGQWWDRANLGLLDPLTDTRTLVTPSGGRTYNASGVGGTCGTSDQGGGGWAGVSDSWATSSWTAGALQSATHSGKPMRLQMRYGTDGASNDTGFKFDELTLTDVDVAVADAQSNSCGASSYLFSDDFESGNTAAWSTSGP